MDLNKYSKYIYKVAKDKGFHSGNNIFGNYISNIHGEVSELWEAYRNNELDKLCNKADKMKELELAPLTCLEEELADIIIRTLDLAYTYEVDIEGAIVSKMKYNENRKYRHGNKLA